MHGKGLGMKSDYFIHEEHYQKYFRSGRPGWETVQQMSRTMITIEKVMQNNYVPQNGRVLELGCGAGLITLWLAAKGYMAFGIDISPTAISWARENCLRRELKADFRIGNATEFLDYPENYFDLILDGNMLHCISGPDRLAALINIRSVLRSGGFFHVGTMCGEVKGEFFKDWYDPQTRCVLNEKGGVTRYVGTVDEILDEIKKAGFYILNWELHEANGFGDDNDYLEVDAIRP